MPRRTRLAYSKARHEITLEASNVATIARAAEREGPEHARSGELHVAQRVLSCRHGAAPVMRLAERTRGDDQH